ncbi:uncharacterized protein NPIL_143981 [Nephila pilipes]|uniref:Uncharacterized protein n=1 Tax=Nephila pilipes TaxID=299642 RepID=A0A8X6MPH8_NEPPI|nr:uncharacterized protein NPIL_143981 [Nephila pilipes]
MASTFKYEFYKGKPVVSQKFSPRPSSSNNCIYRETLQTKDKNLPVDVFKLYSGPILNPSMQVIEQHTYSELITKKNKPEKGGLCKYFRSSESEYCFSCLQELLLLQKKRIRENKMKSKKTMEDVENLIKLRINNSSISDMSSKYSRIE